MKRNNYSELGHSYHTISSVCEAKCFTVALPWGKREAMAPFLMLSRAVLAMTVITNRTLSRNSLRLTHTNIVRALYLLYAEFFCWTAHPKTFWVPADGKVLPQKLKHQVEVKYVLLDSQRSQHTV